jgi:cysteine desulfuration protein SufE
MEENKTIQQVEEEIIDEFSFLDSWDDKYEYIIDIGKRLPDLEEKYKVEENTVKGCQSTVWLVSSYENGKVYFKADSNTVITKGLISMLVRVLSGHTPDEIIDAKLEFIHRIGMTTHLAQTRANGLLAMVKKMKTYALGYKAMQNIVSR